MSEELRFALVGFVTVWLPAGKGMGKGTEKGKGMEGMMLLGNEMPGAAQGTEM